MFFFTPSGIFLEDGQPAAVNPTLQSTEMLTLPHRMDGNRLHRFSKVLDTNIGQAHDMFSRKFSEYESTTFSTKYYVIFVLIFSNAQNRGEKTPFLINSEFVFFFN